MRYILLSLLIFLLCLSFCIFSMQHIRTICQSAISLLQAAKLAAGQADFSACRQITHQAQSHWLGYARYFGMTLPHDETDGILQSLAALTQYAALEDRDDYLAGCAELIANLEHLRQMELPSCENIF